MKWQEPPLSTRGRAGSMQIEQDVTELRANPGRWAIVRSRVTAEVARSYRKRGCEAVTRSLPGTTPPRFDIYARWPDTELADLADVDEPRTSNAIPAGTPSDRMVQM